jgi:hypothetical protein
MSATEPEPGPPVVQAPLTPVWVTNAIRTSGGTGPGVVYVPPAEAADLVARRMAVHGTEPPRGIMGAW